MRLNGRPIRIRGLNRHQAYPYVGYAMPARAQKRDAHILKYRLGLNAVRTSHYPQSQISSGNATPSACWCSPRSPAGSTSAARPGRTRRWRMCARWSAVPQPSLHLHVGRAHQRERGRPRLLPAHQSGGPPAGRYPADRRRALLQAGSELLEDVYTYNDFFHNGENAGVEPKHRGDLDKTHAYLVTEHNGHMFPTKMFDDEPHRTSHIKRHYRVLSDVAASADHAGSFGWCMADYNTHRDFGSGDQICYHGVLDMFRNPKPAAYVYASQSDREPVLEVNPPWTSASIPAAMCGTFWS
ncbi:MAG: glycoside hydrolase family 2 TIM barrel-domain containing protein [Oscillospiraceae bacterium]